MSIPKVSVCVVTYNQEVYIETCLRSIVEQEVDFQFEVIVSDDASTDGTIDVIKKYHSQYPDIIRPFFHPSNITAGINFQFAHNHAKGEYVAHCDGDDFYLPGKLQKQVNFLDNNPAYVQLWHRQRLVDDKNNIVGKFPYRYMKTLLYRKLKMKDLAVSYSYVGQHSSQMYRRAARTRYDEQSSTIDYFYALDIASKGFSIHMNEFLGAYRIGNASTLTTTVPGKNFVEKSLVNTALFYTEKYGLGKQFYGNLWVRKILSIYSKEKPSEEFEAGFQKLKKFRSTRYLIKSLIAYLFIHSSFNLFRIISGYFKIMFKRQMK